MGMSRLFWPQELLDQWIVDEKISLDGESLTIHDENRAYKVSQAVYFIKDVGDGQDTYRLVGRAKALKQLESLDAEHYMDSVLVGDSAYQVQPGFIGEPFPADTKETTKKGDEQGRGETKNVEEANDKELLAKFLIENL